MTDTAQPAPKIVPTPAIEDVSQHFGVLGAERMFRSEAGYLVKVHAQRLGSDDPGTLHFRLRGSLCTAAGVIEQLDDGTAFTGAAHMLAVKSESQVDIAAELAAARELIVRRMETAALHHAAARSLEGVGPLAS
jgi:hypothetical protein